MDIVKFTERFQEVELKYNLFQVENEEGLLYWDIVRHNVFYAIYYQTTGINSKSIDNHNNLLQKLYNLFKYIQYTLKLSRVINKKTFDYICFSTSRYKNENNKNIDYAINDVLLILTKQNTLILENNIQFDEDYHYSSYFNSGVIIATYKNKLKKLFNNKPSLYEVSCVLLEEFDLTINLNDIIEKEIERFNIEYKYYKKLFTRLKPKKIFLVQSMIQKGLYNAANILEIEVSEVQHGLVSFIHPAYEYPKNIDLTHLNTFPTNFLSFSSFWSNNINYPVKKIINIGNSFFSQKTTRLKKEYEITIISANIYVEDLIKLLEELLLSGYKGKTAFKLHPNQFQDFDCINKHFEPYPNVIVISTQFSIKELLSLSNSILAVQSTCVYEALYNQVKVLLYKIKDYKTHEDVFSNPNVYQLDNYSDILKVINNEYIQFKNTSFFEPFNTECFSQLLKD